MGFTPPKNADVPPLPTAGRPVNKEGLIWLVCGYVSLMILGYVLLHKEGWTVSGYKVPADKALFFSINAATLTGFQGSLRFGDDWRPQLLFLVLTLAGSLVSMIVGGLAVVRIVRLPYGDKRVVAASAITTGIGMAVGGAAMLASDYPLLPSFLLGASAVGNSGVAMGALPALGSWQTQLILLPLAIFGGLGVPVLMEIYDLITTGRRVSTYSRTVLVMTAGLYLAGLVSLSALQFIQRGSADISEVGSDSLPTAVLNAVARHEPAGRIYHVVQHSEQGRSSYWVIDVSVDGSSDTRRTLRFDASGQPVPSAAFEVLSSASTQSANSRTAGFAFQYAQLFPRSMQWAIIALMIVGASPAGTGGGIKTTTVVELFGGVRKALAGRAPGRAFGIAVLWVAIYAMIVALSFVVLLITEQHVAADRLLFESVSAASNVGLSHDAIMLTGPSLMAVCFAMLAGRLAPMGVLWYMAQTTTDADLPVA